MKGKKHYRVEEALDILQRYCAYQDRCHREVEEKLKSLGMQEEARAHILGALLTEGFLNEERFSRSFSRGKFRIKGWGRQRIIRELRQRGLTDYNIRLGLSEIDEEEYREQFLNTAAKALEAAGGRTTLEQKRKIWNYLEYRGWERDLIAGFIGQEP